MAVRGTLHFILSVRRRGENHGGLLKNKGVPHTGNFDIFVGTVASIVDY